MENTFLSQMKAENSSLTETFVLTPRGSGIIRYDDLMARPRTRPAKYAYYDMMKGLRGNIVYIVRSWDYLLYIGASRWGARERMNGHISSKNSALGQCIRDNYPYCNDWTVEILSFETRTEAFEAEAYLIRTLKPVLNIQFNQGGNNG